MTSKADLHDDATRAEIVQAMLSIIENAKGILETFGHRVNVVVDPLGEPPPFKIGPVDPPIEGKTE